MRTRAIIKKCLGILLLVIAIPMIAPFVGLKWSPLNCQYQDIDLNTGRMRSIDMLYWLSLNTQFHHTSISQALGVDDLGHKEGEWKRVNTFSSGGSNSPHHTYHNALHQAKALGLIFQTQLSSAEEKREMASTVLRLWKESGGDTTANDYINSLWDF